jgi:hypothetical protein
MGEHDQARRDRLRPRAAWTAYLTGCLVGAATGAVLRFLVAVTCLSADDAAWGVGGSTGILLLASFSALIGMVLGAVSGVTCRPILGAVIGGVLSAGSCLTLAVLPAQLLHAPGGTQTTQMYTMQIGGLVAMAIAGALAGGIGALAGKALKKVKDKGPS